MPKVGLGNISIKFGIRKYFHEVMDCISMKSERFMCDLCDQFRSPHLWKKESGD